MFAFVCAQQQLFSPNLKLRKTQQSMDEETPKYPINEREQIEFFPHDDELREDGEDVFDEAENHLQQQQQQEEVRPTPNQQHHGTPQQQRIALTHPSTKPSAPPRT